MYDTEWVLLTGLAVMAFTVVTVAHMTLRGSAPADRAQLLRALSTVIRALADVVRALWRRT
ncbi:hypothetical protein STAFG_0151 [Streptomyces afghaniensis 772]|jgi:hypothetical protein|uniref:Uncharacterized protein n=1 Tax=Streptomyces afghaniensis 772 TaxID=1283301 RepID=S4MZU3_9ACTN|nr:hypothetical protein [Streptomyces afghaniensis]EPJ42796.1 hypothetical protein STAFG_0151 [Streptomyces afghaniensis 772]